jgi:hypothetical protein
VHSYACKLFFITILEGELRRFEPRPHLEAREQTQLKVLLFESLVAILYGVVVMTLETCVGRPGSTPLCVYKFLYTCFDYVIICIYNLFDISKKIAKMRGVFLNGKVLKIINH